MADLPAPPLRGFASDNTAGAHPSVIAAVAAANEGHAPAYGADRWTAEAHDRFRDLFGRNVETLLVWNGTGANVMALATLLGPAQAVVCSQWSHVATDETGAPERFLGAKLIDLLADAGKLVPEQIEAQVGHLGNVHHVQPRVVSLTQSTELGTVYTADEIAALCEVAHRHGMLIHVDGARIANAVAATGATRAALRSLTVDAGVDVLSFGGTKNGLLGADAVVFLDPSLARVAPFVRKQATQLASKMRFVAAQFNALLHDDLWLELAGRSNAMARRLYELVAPIPGVHLDAPPVVNALFPRLSRPAIDRLREWSFFWEWDAGRGQVRWVTAWDTSDDDVTAFAAGVRAAVADGG